METLKQLKLNAWNLGRVIMLLSVLAWSFSACSEDAASGSCEISANCPQFYICTDGKCAQSPCATDAECGDGEICVEDPSGALMCTAIECGPDTPCALATQACVDGLCQESDNLCKAEGSDCLYSGECCEGFSCSGDKLCIPHTPCVTDAECEAGVCDVKTGECINAPNCTTEGCTAGTVCNEETGACEPDGGSNNAICSPCTNDSDCADSFCTALGGSTYCVPACENNDDCITGYKCFNVQGSGLRCVPGSYTCEQPCIQSGCPTGKTCDFSSGECIPQLDLCDSCEKDDQCGVGSRCVIVGTLGKLCIPQCVNNTCSQGGSCQLFDDVSICHPGAECCFGDNCSGSETGTETGTETGSETGETGCNPPCSDPFPVCNPQNDTCVQCLANEDCPAGEFCDMNTKLCTSDVCAACEDPYPACTTINGQPACVQCVQDADCPSGDCDEATFFCLGAPPGVVSDSCKCSSDSDCPTGTQFSLKCNTSSGVCYDTGGACDNISACCDATSGSQCVSALELFGGSGGLPIPGGLPTGGAFGLCTCSSELAELACMFDPTQCGDTAGNCQPGLSCSPFGLILGFLGASQNSNGDFDLSSFCQ
jgi:Cys-rich repeat protein